MGVYARGSKLWIRFRDTDVTVRPFGADSCGAAPRPA
jgi:hypothetical protein